MNPEARFELDKGEWRSDPPHISYAADDRDSSDY